MRTILITGGNDGLGKALAERLATDNQVVLVGRAADALRNLADIIGARWLVCDVRDPSQIEQTIDKVVKEFGAIDILINNAGVVVNGDLTSTRNSDIENVIATNTLGAIYMAKAVLTHMASRRTGQIVNINSQSGLSARPGRSVYNASKWAITGFTKALQEEAATHGVRVTGFYPGTMDTNFFHKAGIDMKGAAIPIDDAVRAIEFILSVNGETAVTEMGIKPFGPQ
ncbi:NAD(P)-dependent dehydrogenase (short-subunit alcohol dehydrogenase family) [Mycolicibacterium sp. BK556]|uniref:SDR family NAD(P)-dependent oxidoreductase n=1 Tax=unclassified Mycolicibacterium TaxID=2636767 RepID=UPI00161DC7D0|nr:MULTISPECIES: SDR family oxidoreductase [unclassified Mycolicibacterium]MBB3602759.1 NAD(P)-dependent dehydrogenase (short-subunit alcohol dehydrogenase family) [Mycolicibacterium sp. BK556]MBB3632954.1 NAD(P)-dependent dehydrogenase (short-subunit alcohol dehydrogenase family) [Mycolicibacterium sp. BK607]